MNKQEYLNEEHNKKVSKTIMIIGTLILITAIAIGVVIIINWCIMNNNYNSKESINRRLQIDKQIGKLEDEQTNEWVENRHSDRYYELEYQIEELEAQKEEGEPLDGGFFIGITVIFFGIMISMPCFFVANQRKIIAYQYQQVSPVAQEGIEKMAPSIGKVAKEVVESVTDEPENKDK